MFLHEKLWGHDMWSCGNYLQPWGKGQEACRDATAPRDKPQPRLPPDSSGWSQPALVGFLLFAAQSFLIDISKLERGFPSGSDGKESACNAGDSGLIPGLGRSPEKGEGYPLQYSMDRGAWGAAVHGVAWLNFIKCLFFFQHLWWLYDFFCILWM